MRRPVPADPGPCVSRGVVVAGAPTEWPRAALARAGVTSVEAVGPGLVEGLRRLSEVLRAGERVVVVDSHAVLPAASLARLADDPSARTGLLVAPGGHSVRVAHGGVQSAGSEHHQVSGAQAGSLGAFVVAPEHAEEAASAFDAMAWCAEQHGWSGDVVDHAVVALVRRAVPVRAITVSGPATRSADPAMRAAVARELAAGGDERALRESSNRMDDGFYSTFVLRRLSKPLTEVALRLGLSPNQVSLLSLAVGLLAAALFAVGATVPTVIAAILLQASIVVDCVDGEVARRTRRFSALGAWLDASTDRVKEYAVYAGLALAADGDLWLLAGAVLTMQTVRHMTDYAFERVQVLRESWVEPRDLGDPSDGATPSYGGAVDASQRASRRRWVFWAKKAVHMQIGERWLVISVGSVVAGPRATLGTLLVLGLMAVAYTTVGRLLRVRRWDHPLERSGREVLLPQLDLGPLLARVWRPSLGGPLAWTVPGLLRLLELATLLVLVRAVAPDALAWAYALVFVLAFHHYDALYRALGGGAPPQWLVFAGLGLEGRVLALLVAAALGASVLSAVVQVGTLVLAGLFVVVASTEYVVSLNGGEA